MRVPVLAGLLLLAACASAPPKPIEVNASEAMRTDFLKRLQEALRVPDGEDADTVMNSLEHWLPEWQTQQRTIATLEARVADLERALQGERR